MYMCLEQKLHSVKTFVPQDICTYPSSDILPDIFNRDIYPSFLIRTSTPRIFASLSLDILERPPAKWHISQCGE